jgi:hypothetical protein
MEASMPEKNATDPGMLSLVPPDEVQALFGDPPLLRGEDDGLYYTLMEHFTKLVGPKDMMEWLWVKDMTDHTWEIRRQRRFKVLFVELQRDQVHHDREMFASIQKPTPVPVPDSEKDSAEFFMSRIDRYKDVDRLIASAEVRRDRTLREIERRREHLARRRRETSHEIVDGEFAEVPQVVNDRQRQVSERHDLRS